MMNKNFATIVSLFLLCMPITVLATEGALEINQACVAGGCFPGDTAGFPVTIATRGNYELTSNLTLDNTDQSAIQVNSDNVVIDLKGFGIFGPNVCTGAQDDCSSKGVGNGITSTNSNIVIRNGLIRGMGQNGIGLQAQATIENVVSEHNSNAGIIVGTGSTVRNSNANFNGFFGIHAIESRVTDCSVADNGQTGITVNRSVVTRAISVRSGTWAGIQDGYGSQFHNSLVRDNVIGIESINGATSIINTTILANTSVGVFARGDTGAGDPNGMPVLLRGNTIVLNNKDNPNENPNENPQLGGGGTFIELGTNYCGSDTTCP